MKYHCLFAACILSTTIMLAQTSSTIGQPNMPIEKMLNPEGTVNTMTGFTGGVDARGYRMKTGPHGEPMFIRSAQYVRSHSF